ncbi:hypothetical protein Tco_0502632 [Tanacetum coccineum]
MGLSCLVASGLGRVEDGHPRGHIFSTNSIKAVPVVKSIDRLVILPIIKSKEITENQEEKTRTRGTMQLENLGNLSTMTEE